MPAQASPPRARIQLSSSQRPLTFEVEAINERGESVSTAIAGLVRAGTHEIAGVRIWSTTQAVAR